MHKRASRNNREISNKKAYLAMRQGGFSGLVMLILAPVLLQAQENVISLASADLPTCSGSGTLTVQFQQPSTNNLTALSFNIRFNKSHFDSVYPAGGTPPPDPRPSVLASALLTNHTLTAQPLIGTLDPDSNPSTADWMILIYTTDSSFPLIPNGAVATMQFFPAATATNGTQIVQVYSVIGVNALAVEYPESGTNGSLVLSGCTTPNRVFLPLISKP